VTELPPTPGGHRGPWVAVFADGPAQGSADRAFAVGPVWHKIRLVELSFAHGWTIVGGDGIDASHESPEPWPGEVRYELQGLRSADIDDVAGLVATYIASDER
jgi:hypothetical protein